MLPTEELQIRTVLRSAQDQADAMLACGGALRPTALLMRMAEDAGIDEAALVDLGDYDAATLQRFVRTNAERDDVDVIALSKMVSSPRAPSADPAEATSSASAILIHLIAHHRETWVVNDIDPVTGRLRRGRFDPTRTSRTFLDTPAND